MSSRGYLEIKSKEELISIIEDLMPDVAKVKILEHEILSFRGVTQSVRNACENAGVPTTFQPSGIPRDLVDPVRDIIAERDLLRDDIAKLGRRLFDEYKVDGNKQSLAIHDQLGAIAAKGNTQEVVAPPVPTQNKDLALEQKEN